MFLFGTFWDNFCKAFFTITQKLIDGLSPNFGCRHNLTSSLMTQIFVRIGWQEIFFHGNAIFYLIFLRKKWSFRHDNSKTNWDRNFGLEVHRLHLSGSKKWRPFRDPPDSHVVVSGHFLPKNPIFSTIWAKIGLHGNRAITKMFATITNKSELFLSLIHISEPTRPY